MLFGREHITKESLDILKHITHEIDGDMSYNYPLGDIQNKILHHHNHILYDIRSLLGNEEKVYLELGTYAGGSSALMSSHPYPTKIYGVEIVPEKIDIQSFHVRSIGPDPGGVARKICIVKRKVAGVLHLDRNHGIRYGGMP